MTPTRNPALVTSGDIRRAARELPLVLALIRHSLPLDARVCSSCHHVFSPAGRVGARCMDCEAMPQ